MVNTYPLAAESLHCRNLFINDTEFNSLNTKLEELNFDASKFHIFGFDIIPYLVGQFVNLTYSLKGEYKFKKITGTVIRHFGSYLAVFGTDGTATKLDSNQITSIEIMHAPNPNEPMPFVEVKSDYNGLKGFSFEHSVVGNEIIVKVGKETVQGYIVNSSSGRVIVYSPKLSEDAGNEVFINVRLERGSFNSALMRTPTHPKIPFSIRRLNLIYKLYDAREYHKTLIDRYKSALNENKTDQEILESLITQLNESKNERDIGELEFAINQLKDSEKTIKKLEFSLKEWPPDEPR